MNDRTTLADAFYSLAMFIIFTLLFTSCASKKQVIYPNQFNSGVSYNLWDINTNGVLSKDEFYSSIYKIVDINGNTYLSGAEWQKANYFFNTCHTNNYGSFKKWDSNSNKQINKTEFTSSFTGSKLFEAWDKNSNNKLNQAELVNGLFDAWNINDDATLSSFETENWREAAI